VVRLRMEKAKKMLVRTRLPVAEIAAECGFAQSGYFSKVFRRQTGSLPLAYRSQTDQAAL
ncbi:MAG: helix-turn-helix transcriptional regulator, partial [Lentisphaeria bacterium]|nr:helix-turn-helix transcriptional regulator [Lentisphaeria bacterium]